MITNSKITTAKDRLFILSVYSAYSPSKVSISKASTEKTMKVIIQVNYSKQKEMLSSFDRNGLK